MELELPGQNLAPCITTKHALSYLDFLPVCSRVSLTLAAFTLFGRFLHLAMTKSFAIFKLE